MRSTRMMMIGGLFATAATFTTGCPVDPPTTVNNLASGNMVHVRGSDGTNRTFSNPGGLQPLGTDAAGMAVLRDLNGFGNPVNDQYLAIESSGTATLVAGDGSTLLALGTLYDAMFSLDGSTLAVVGPGAGGSALTVYDVETLTVRRTIAPVSLTVTIGFDVSRDGSKVVYRNVQNGVSVADTAGTATPVEVFTPADGCIRPRLTSAGRAAAHCAGRDIRTVNADGTAPRTIVPGVTGSSNNLIGEIGTGRIIFERQAGAGPDSEVMVVDDVAGATPLVVLALPYGQSISSIGGRALTAP